MTIGWASESQPDHMVASEDRVDRTMWARTGGEGWLRRMERGEWESEREPIAISGCDSGDEKRRVLADEEVDSGGPTPTVKPSSRAAIQSSGPLGRYRLPSASSAPSSLSSVSAEEPAPSSSPSASSRACRSPSS